MGGEVKTITMKKSNPCRSAHFSRLCHYLKHLLIGGLLCWNMPAGDCQQHLQEEKQTHKQLDNILTHAGTDMASYKAALQFSSMQIDNRQCASTEYLAWQRQRYNLPPDDMVEEAIASYLASANLAALPASMTIPVVVHVIHSGEPIGLGSNISNQAVFDQIRALNDAFQRNIATRYGSTINTGGYDYSTLAASMDIEFVLATVDPEGNPTNGINRYQGPRLTYDPDVDQMEDVKAMTQWNPKYYLNIWSANLTDGDLTGLLGYAQFPDFSGLMGLPASAQPARTDGVVSDYRTIGSHEYGGAYNLFPGYKFGGTTIHEVGHFLGLRHTWGDGPGDCTVDDFVSDTPLEMGANGSCSPKHTCGSPDLIENWMDYGPDDCKNIFTNGQYARVMAVLMNSPRRMELLNSQVHLGIAPPLPVNDLCAGAIALVPNGPSETANLCGATMADAPAACPGSDEPPYGIWYSIQGNGEVITVTTNNGGTNFDTYLYVYSGSCGSLSCVGYNDDDGTVGGASTVIFPSQVGVTYYVYASGWEGAADDLEISATSAMVPPGAPANDLCSAASVLTCGVLVVGSTVDAIADPEAAPCGGGTVPGVWYRFVGTGDVVQMLAFSTFDHRIQVFQGSCGSFQCVPLTFDVFFNSVPGAEYYIYVTGDPAGVATGLFGLQLNCIPMTDPGLLCQTAISINCGDQLVGNNVSTLPAALSGSDGIPCFQFDNGAARTAQGNAVWYTFTGNGQVIDLSVFSDFDAALDVYRGTTCANLERIACSDDVGRFSSEAVTFLSMPGEIYYILVSGFAIEVYNPPPSFFPVYEVGDFLISLGCADCNIAAVTPTNVEISGCGSLGYIAYFCVEGTGLPSAKDDVVLLLNGVVTPPLVVVPNSSFCDNPGIRIGVIVPDPTQGTTVEIDFWDGACTAGPVQVAPPAEACDPTERPNCRSNLNLALNPDGSVVILAQELITNCTEAEPAIMTLEDDAGNILYQNDQASCIENIIIPGCDFVGKTLKFSASNQFGVCWSEITVKQANIPLLQPGNFDVYCNDAAASDWQRYLDRFYGNNNGEYEPSIDRKMAIIPCVGTQPAHFVSDWPLDAPCDSDTAKVILREFQAFSKDGVRGSVFDTVIVWKLPAITLANTYCQEKDTVYCGEGKFGPWMLVPEDPSDPLNDIDNDGTSCDTICFFKEGLTIKDADGDGHIDSLHYYLNKVDSKCGMLLHVDDWVYQSDACSPQWKIKLEIKQSCYASIRCDETVPTAPPNGLVGNNGYWTCEFWVTDLDTAAPVVDCKDDNLLLTTVYTSTHECAAHTYVPPVEVKEDWSGIKQVKAIVDGVGTLVLTYNAESKCYDSHLQVKLPHRELPYKVIYEVYDSCHNIGYDSCYIRVKDHMRPVAVSDKGVTVSLSDKKVWVDAATFDEGSWDNCDINFLLARRSDWFDACITLCDDLDTCFIGEHHDTIWRANLETDKHEDEVEAHYAKTMEWLCEDGDACGELLYNAWQYDLAKYATLNCVDHPYDVDEAYFDRVFREAMMTGEFRQKWKRPGGLFLGTSVPNTSFYVGLDGTSSDAFADAEVGGATFDHMRGQIIYSHRTSLGFRELYAVPFGGDAPELLGTVSANVFGLASIDGRLIAATGAAEIVEIDLDDFSLTTLFSTSGSGFAGIGADQMTGKLYGADDFSRRIMELDLETGLLTEVANYPAGESDIDGLAVGDGRIYLSTDEPGVIYVYNIATGTYEDPIPSPVTTNGAQVGGAAFLPALDPIIDTWKQIGGGWSDAVPFSCEDACGPVTVEILVMDYWCNWSTAWTKVWVEDKTPVEVVKDVVDEEQITCKIYKEARYAYPDEIHPVSLEYIVGQAKDGEQDAYDALDEIFGGYCKAWRDPYGNYVDNEGTEIDCDITFYDSICKCTSYYDQVRVYDEHLGYLWVDSLVTKCDYYQDTIDFQKGVVVVNCEENVYCEQDVWCEIDHCGQGYIFRKFKIWQGCPDEFYDEHGVADSLRHTVDTIYRHQRIWIGNECELNKYMFHVPYDTEVVTCDIEYGPDGNVTGAAGPEYTGYATYKFDDDCRIVGIGHSDKVFKIVGGEAACYKILRTWYFADWCGYGEPLDGQWWRNRELVTDTCVQKIIVRDTTPPTCLIVGPVEDGGSIEVGACYFDLAASVVGMDACGVIKYYWELKDITDEDNVIVSDNDHGELSGDTTEGFDISSADLPHGSYKLVVTIQDDCANENYCAYYFDVVSVKKPSPVCISSLTARLTPWDSDQDGVLDSAHAIVWAEEFNSSSSEACTDTALEYRVELINGIDDDTWEEDTSYLEVFCDDFGSHLARLWVISWPSGTVDFCDVVLIVQSDFSGCATTVSGEPGPISQVNDMHDVVGQPQRQGMGQPTQPGIGGRPVGQGLAPSGYLLEQNRPNPFREETTIGFVLPEAMTATLTVYDVTGRVLRSIKGDYAKGYQTVELRKQNLDGHAILYYRLDANDFTATRKMILMN